LFVFYLNPIYQNTYNPGQSLARTKHIVTNQITQMLSETFL